jgi:N-hydroxyarylamine O-acetyltransferase
MIDCPRLHVTVARTPYQLRECDKTMIVEDHLLSTIREAKHEWSTELVDLDAYFDRIGYNGPHTATAETLRALHRAHMTIICFENVDIVLGKGISLDMTSLQTKLVNSGRGGYCFEHNLLFAAVLERLGFPVTRQLARVRRGSQGIRYRSHATLIVEADAQLWLVDVGYGEEGLIEPIQFVDGATLTVGDWTWRVDDEVDYWVLRCLHANSWFDVYALRLEHHHPIDFEVANYYTSTNPRSIFVGKLIAQRGGERVRHALLDQVLRRQYANGRTERAELSSAEIVHALHRTFGVNLTNEDALLLRQHFSAYACR